MSFVFQGKDVVIARKEHLMNLSMLSDPQVWAFDLFRDAELGDARRTKRLVEFASQAARNPSVSVPKQVQGNWSDLKGAYRLLHEEDVTPQQILAPCTQKTLQACDHPQERTLLIQDLSELDYGYHPIATGLGPVGSGTHQGVLIQSILALDEPTREIKGLAAFEVFNRVARPKHETRKEHVLRPRETDAWLHLVCSCGHPSPGTQWIHVGDRAADMYRLMWTTKEMGCDYVFRSKQDRVVSREEDLTQHVHLYAELEQQPVISEKVISLRATPQHRARQARLQLRLYHHWINPSGDDRTEFATEHAQGRLKPLETWSILVREIDAPTRGEVERHPKEGTEQEQIEPLDWLLFTSVPTQTVEEAWQRVEWYRQRWIIEEYHHALKTGCRVEDAQLRDADALKRLVAILAPVAVRLLQLRSIARDHPDDPASDVFSQTELLVLAQKLKQDPSQLTVRVCWRQVAHWGGFLGRKSDGEPGWKTLWTGWSHLQTLVEGFQLASSLSQEKNVGN
jgi:Transposase DNA-binding/Transposase Tn5 dimerisation domain